MGTIVDALQDATTALNAATAKILSLQGSLTLQAQQSQQAATTVINNFLTRPLQQTFFVDPINGNDSNTGLTYATAKRSLDATLAVISSPTLGNQSALVLMFGDQVLQNRYSMGTDLVIWGVQPANVPSGYTFAQRKLSFLGLAANSPDPNIGVMSAGINFVGSSSLTTSNINPQLPSVPASVPGYYDCPFIAAAAFSVFMSTFQLTVTDTTARSLFGSFIDGNTGAYTGHIVASLFPTLGPNAAGHLFRGIAAGGDPNSIFAYQSNIHSA